VDSAEQAKKLVKHLEGHIRFYKVGLQLFITDSSELKHLYTFCEMTQAASVVIWVPNRLVPALRRTRDLGFPWSAAFVRRMVEQLKFGAMKRLAQL
jgi:hypothetical protein